MKFDELDARMRVFETTHDLCVLPGLFMVARLDGRGFTRLTKEVHSFEAPFDARFRDLMLDTTEHLMTGCGFSFVYGYTQSDEISLLFSPGESGFQRKLRKLISVLAGEASAKFALSLQAHASFDCRISELPTVDLVIDYFRWRNEDAHRNALNAHCYWALRGAGHDVAQATKSLEGLSVAEKNELLFQLGINFDSLPLWQKRGSGLYWEEYDRSAMNPITQQSVTARRRRIRRDLELPMKDIYSAFLEELVTANWEPGYASAASQNGSPTAMRGPANICQQLLLRAELVGSAGQQRASSARCCGSHRGRGRERRLRLPTQRIWRADQAGQWRQGSRPRVAPTDQASSLIPRPASKQHQNWADLI